MREEVQRISKLVADGKLSPEDAAAFWKKYQDSYITEGDIHFLKSIGVNSIRIPFNYRLFTTENYCGQNNPNRGFELLDRVIGWCTSFTSGSYRVSVRTRCWGPLGLNCLATRMRLPRGV